MWYGRSIGNNQYILITTIGHGAYSQVWLTYSIEKKSFYATKIINDEYGDIAQRESDALFLFKNAESPLGNIIDYFVEDNLNDPDSATDSGSSTYSREEDDNEEEPAEEEETGEGSVEEETATSSSGSYFDPFKYHLLVFPLYGGTLYEVYKHMPIPPNVIESVYQQISDKLNSLHERFGLLHGDVKPENIAFVGMNKRCDSIIQRFYDLGGFEKYLNLCDGDIQTAAYKLIDELLGDEISVESSDEYVSSSTCSGKSLSWNDVKSRESTVDEDDDSTSETESCYSDDDTIDITDEELQNIKVELIDYSHVHTTDEDLEYVPTRYYRCKETIEKQPIGFFKDWFALACTMYELQNQKLLFDPPKKKRKQAHLKMIEEKSELLKKWIPESYQKLLEPSPLPK
jgi:serine/threonine protein kinase